MHVSHPPQEVKTYKAAGVKAKEDCRPYVVYKHYIDTLAIKHGEQNIFMCEPLEDGSAKVFSCASCKHKKHQVRYQCSSYLVSY